LWGQNNLNFVGFACFVVENRRGLLWRRNLLEAVADLDREYLASWAGKLGLADLLREVLP